MNSWKMIVMLASHYAVYVVASVEVDDNEDVITKVHKKPSKAFGEGAHVRQVEQDSIKALSPAACGYCCLETGLYEQALVKPHALLRKQCRRRVRATCVWH